MAKVSMYMKKDKCKTIYYSFYQRELIIKIAVWPLFVFLYDLSFNFCSKYVEK